MENPSEELNFPGPSNAPPPRTPMKADTLNSEYLYYTSVLKVVAPALTTERDRKAVIPWVRKLFAPEYHSSQFREKRNKYLLYLTLILLNDEISGIFRFTPPQGALPEFSELQPEPTPQAEWETDKMWQETLQTLPDDFQKLECSVHTSTGECAADHHLDKILDQEFQFLLYLARPYAALLTNVDDRTKVATWLQMLCTIQDDACSSMRGIRNDYLMSLLGYISDLRVVGPFGEYPPWKTLPPLAEAAKMAASSKPVTDPSCPEANEFMSTQSVPDDGAFCYIAITGDLVASTLAPTP